MAGCGALTFDEIGLQSYMGLYMLFSCLCKLHDSSTFTPVDVQNEQLSPALAGAVRMLTIIVEIFGKSYEIYNLWD